MRENGRIDIVPFFKFAEPPAVLRDGVKRRVGLVHPEVDKERFLRAMTLFDKRDRVVRIFVDRHLFSGAVESPVLVVAVFARQRRVRDHVVRQMPLAKMGCRITCALEKSRE